ncbi:MAG: hypothetical protein JXB88_04010 [Spirochaetales bacterium]|nr:hypothetical protein [Spirochaetales bacterium]
MEKKIIWGISQDLQAHIRYEPNACKGYVLDLSLGCSHHCLYCLFSPLEMKVYKLHNPQYKGDTIPLKLDKFLMQKEFPPVIYMSYSSDPLGNETLIRSTVKALHKLLDNDVNVFFISKGIFNDEVLEEMKRKPHLMHIQIGLINADDERNRIIEPGAPSYNRRLENLQKLSAIEGLGNLAVRIDPLLPLIDDHDENIIRILNDVSSLGVKEAVFGYVILTKGMIERWKGIKNMRACAESLSEKTPTISDQELFSIPYDVKIKKFEHFREICEEYGVKMSCCGCKDERLKNTSFEWICHPFNRKRRKEFINEDSKFRIEYTHLK